MSIIKLFVEGKLEAEILYKIFQGAPAVVRGGSKNSLKPRARSDREENGIEAGYLRDRDFDFDPPDDLSTPTVDIIKDNIPFGWRWCRHEIENYLIEPVFISAVTNWSIEEIKESIRKAAKKIQIYQAARWTVGFVRRALPPQYEMKTRPEGLNEIDLPDQPDATSERWATQNISNHRSRIVSATEDNFVKAKFDEFCTRFNSDFIADVSKVLLWFAGKDLLAGMAESLRQKGIGNPGELRASIRDWMIANPERAIEMLPEWRALIQVLRE